MNIWYQVGFIASIIGAIGMFHFDKGYILVALLALLAFFMLHGENTEKTKSTSQILFYVLIGAGDLLFIAHIIKLI